MNSALQGSILTILGGTLGAFIKGAWDFYKDNKKQVADLKTKAGDQEILAWQEWREDNAQLRIEIKDLREDVKVLRQKIDDSERRELLKDQEIIRITAERDKAERRCAELVVENDNLKIQLDAALRAQDAHSIAALERKRFEDERRLN